MSGISPRRVIELLAEFGHDAGNQPELADVDLVEFFSGEDLARLDFSSIKIGLSLSFEDSDLRQAVFRGMTFNGSSFMGSDVRGADFRDTTIGHGAFGTKHDNAPVGRLEGARFDNANVSVDRMASVALNRAVLVGARVSGELFDVDLSHANLTGTTIDGNQARSCDLTGVTGTDVELGGTWDRCVFDGVHLPNARLGGSGAILLAGCRAEQLSLPGASFSSAVSAEIVHCQFPDVNLDEVSLREAFIQECDLSGARLRGADLTGADIDATNLSGADLTDAILTGAKLTGVDLTGAVIGSDQLEEAEMRDVTGP